jgi:hypothetical protein
LSIWLRGHLPSRPPLSPILKKGHFRPDDPPAFISATQAMKLRGRGESRVMSATRSLASASANDSFRREAQAARRGFVGLLYG